MAWNINNPRVIYHGTTLSAARDILQSGVNLNLCQGLTDFGRGFYVTTSLHQAKNWANTRCLPWSGPNLKKIAAVLEFQVDWSQLSQLKNLSFVWEGPTQGSDFWSFVLHCRHGGNHRPVSSQPFLDVVFGPVCVWPQQLVIANADQISFHTPAALKILGRGSIKKGCTGTLADPFVR